MFDDQWLRDPEFFWVSRVPDDDMAYCKLCKKEISVNRGKSALRSHAKGKKHSELSLQVQNGYKTAVQPVNPTYALSRNCDINDCSASTSTGKRFQSKKMPCVSSSAKHLALASQRKNVKIAENVFLEQIRYGNKCSVSRFQRSLEYSSGSQTRDKYLEDMYRFGETGKKEKKREEKRKEKKKKKVCSLDDDDEEDDDDDDSDTSLDKSDESDESDESDDISNLIKKMIANKV